MRALLSFETGLDVESPHRKPSDDAIMGQWVSDVYLPANK